jgi:hypothetical protein
MTKVCVEGYRAGFQEVLFAWKKAESFPLSYFRSNHSGLN